MYLSNKIIEAVITEAAGKDFLPMVDILKNKKEVSELKLANAIKKNINLTRRMLYKLSSANLVSSRKIKDKRKGWYIYYWSLKLNMIKYLAKKSKEDYLKKLNERLEKEKKEEYFVCPNRCVRLSFEKAIDVNFRCPECGKLMGREDNSIKIKEIMREIKRLNGCVKCVAVKS